MARAFTEVLDWLATVLAGLDGMAHQAAELARDAGHRLRQRDGAWRDPDRPDRRNLLTVELLDRVLDHLGLDAESFLARSEVKATDLGRLGRQGLEAELRRWVEGEVVRLADATLADVFGGYIESTDTVGRLVDLLTAGQPLVRFNDDLHRLWPEGLPAQYQVIVESSDGTLDAALADACIQVGLPSPQLTTLDPGEGERSLALRVVQLVSGLAWFSAAERLVPMAAVHAQVMAEADAELETREGLRAALRDGVESETLASILPAQVVDALAELHSLQTAAQAARTSGPSASHKGAKRRRKVSTIDDEPAVEA